MLYKASDSRITFHNQEEDGEIGIHMHASQKLIWISPSSGLRLAAGKHYATTSTQVIRINATAPHSGQETEQEIISCLGFAPVWTYIFRSKPTPPSDLFRSLLPNQRWPGTPSPARFMHTFNFGYRDRNRLFAPGKTMFQNFCLVDS